LLTNCRCNCPGLLPISECGAAVNLVRPVSRNGWMTLTITRQNSIYSDLHVAREYNTTLQHNMTTHLFLTYMSRGTTSFFLTYVLRGNTKLYNTTQQDNTPNYEEWHNITDTDKVCQWAEATVTKMTLITGVKWPRNGLNWPDPPVHCFGPSLEGPLGELLPGDFSGVWIDSEQVLDGSFC
jgi:hypothetical protein